MNRLHPQGLQPRSAQRALCDKVRLIQRAPNKQDLRNLKSLRYEKLNGPRAGHFDHRAGAGTVLCAQGRATIDRVLDRGRENRAQFELGGMCLRDVVVPLLHQGAAALEHVGTGICALDATHGVAQCHLG